MGKLDMYKFVGELFSDEYEKLEVKDPNEHYIKCQMWGIPFRIHWYSGNDKFRVEAGSHDDLAVILSLIAIQLGRMRIDAKEFDCEFVSLIIMNDDTVIS